MSVGSLNWKDAGNVTRALAARTSVGGYYPMDAPEVLIARIIATGTLGDAALIASVPVVVLAVRLWNGGGVACHAKLHNLAVAPTVGVTPVIYSASAQAGANNPDPRVSGGGVAFTTGLGVTLSPGINNDDTSSVVVGTAILILEYHLATPATP